MDVDRVEGTSHVGSHQGVSWAEGTAHGKAGGEGPDGPKNSRWQARECPEMVRNLSEM